jgi:HlyD family secretion protein
MADQGVTPGLFRPASTRKLRSPEQLDALPGVTSPIGWASLLVLGLLFLIVAGWGLVGRIPVKVTGKGMILSSAGLYEVTPQATGPLGELSARAGDAVAKDSILARLELPELLGEIRELEQNTELLLAKRELTGRLGAETLRRRSEHRTVRRKVLEASLADDRDRVRWAEDNVVAVEGLREAGIVTELVASQAKIRLQDVQRSIRETSSELHKLDLEAAEEQRQLDGELQELDRQIGERQLHQKTRREEYERRSVLRSPCSGRVVEVTAMPGDVVYEGRPIMRIEQSDNGGSDLKAVLFVAPKDGKKVVPGMAALVTLSTVKASQYGGIDGIVKEVSDQPTSPQAQSRLLANQELAKLLTDSASPFLVTVSLSRTAGASGGFRWSSGPEPGVDVRSGTPCEGSITVDSVPPLSYVIPFFRRALLGGRTPFEPASR